MTWPVTVPSPGTDLLPTLTGRTEGASARSVRSRYRSWILFASRWAVTISPVFLTYLRVNQIKAPVRTAIATALQA